LDLIKVQLQTGLTSQPSAIQLMKRTLADGGIIGLYRGVSAPLLAITPQFAISFLSYDLGKKLARYMHRDGDEIPSSLVDICVASAFSAIPTSLITAPSERLKCLLQIDANKVGKGKAKYAGLFDCTRQIYREGGIISIYKGLGATLLRDIPGSII
jgi:solute carrier family 25 carnitine/acylcarnitine transporter 20/29